MWTALLLSGCDLCGNDIKLTVASPDGKLKAVVFKRSCGATTGFSMQVAVLTANRDVPNEPGNVHREDDQSTISVAWKSNSELLISTTANQSSEKKITLSQGLLRKRTIAIDYQTSAPVAKLFNQSED